MHIRRPQLILLAALLLAGCGPRISPGPVIYVPFPTNIPTLGASASEASTTQPIPTVEVTVDLPHPPVTFDPVRVALMDDSARDVIENVFIGLTYLNPDTGQVEPWLAESWEVSEDGLTWRFRLREDVWWARRNPDTQAIVDERTVIAHDVVYAIRRACEIGLATPTIHPLFVIQGCREIALMAAAGQGTAGVDLGVNEPDDYTVEIRLTEPAAYLPTLLAMPAARPLPWENLNEGWPPPEALWASGPWMIETASGTSITLMRNPFWAAEAMAVGSPDRVVMRFGGSGSGAAQTLVYPQAAFAVFSLEAAPMDNVHVRRALALAADRASLVGSDGIPLTTFAPPGTALAPANASLSPDSAAARSELAEAGYAGCNQMWPVTILTDESAASGALAERLAAMWAAALECPESAFTVETLPLQHVMTLARNPGVAARPQAILLTWQGDYADAHHWLADLFGCRERFPRAFLNQGRMCSADDDLLIQAAGETDPAARAALYAQIHENWFAPSGDVIAIPLFAPTAAFAAPPGVTIRPTVAGPMRFDLWEVGNGAN